LKEDIMSKEVDPDLYQFLKDNETGLYTNKHDNVIAFVHVQFSDLADFAKIVGDSCFEDGGMGVHMFKETVAIELNDIFEGLGHYMSSYANCFGDWDEYMDAVLKIESQY